jgi:hypothetical protein
MMAGRTPAVLLYGPLRYARLRFAAGGATAAFAGFFFVALTASRLFFNASIRLTTRGGASTVGATISSPAILASMMRCHAPVIQNVSDVHAIDARLGHVRCRCPA